MKSKPKGAKGNPRPPECTAYHDAAHIIAAMFSETEAWIRYESLS